MSLSKRLVVFSGAGLSADSGISTFRGSDGLWEDHSLDQVCNFQTWRANREKVHAFYNARRARLDEVEPNRMHQTLADWQKRFGAILITQNVDDLLERAGARDVLHVHGSLREMKCFACGTIWSVGSKAWTADVDTCPTCPCRRGVKPNMVFFGEAAPLYRPMFKHFQSLEKDDVRVVIGTDGAVFPIGRIASGISCRKALNTLAPVPPEQWNPTLVSPAFFHHALYGRAVDRAAELDRIVTGWMA